MDPFRGDDESDISGSASWWLDRRTHPSPAAAFEVAEELIARLAGEPLEVVGDFVLPPLDAGPSRDFQTLHVDFGVPLDPGGAVSLARYTALHVPADRERSGAATWVVPLRDLLGRRSWPAAAELRRRFAAYGASHGRRDGEPAYVEGSMARIVEAADASPDLPSVRADPEFLCGMEFASHTAEEAFFAARGMPLAPVASEIVLEPGELLVFDNLAVAHARRGVRRPGELRQRAFGHLGAGRDGQEWALRRFLAAFA